MNLNQYSISAAQPGLAVERILNLWTPVPGPQEQVKLSAIIRESTTNINTAITRTKREIELLDEYRTRLIADVVTGKLDVREAAAALPEIDPLADNEPDDTNPGDVEPDEMDVTLEEAEA